MTHNFNRSTIDNQLPTVDNDELILEDDDQQDHFLDDSDGAGTWKVLIVDDEPEVHHVTNLALERFTFEGKRLALFSAYSSEEAKRLIKAHPDTAVILLDVVMETYDSGLRVVRHIREELGNKLVRIILRTGQPGETPEKWVIFNYDINDYKTKTELTRQKLFTTMMVALRSYRDLTTIEANRKEIKALYADLAERNTELKTINEKLRREIAERKTIEIELRQSEERYALAADAANDGLWDWNLQTDEIYFSSRWKAMLGCEESDIDHSPNEWFNRVHPDDLASLKHKLEAYLHATATSFSFKHEYRLMHKDGTYRWMLCRGLVVRDTDGQAYRMAGSQSDITPRKKVEEQLQHDALHDSLTGLPNRTLFMDRLAHSLGYAERSQNYLFAVLLIDLDRFKIVDDSLGHTSGNQLLMVMARRLNKCLRPGDTVARLGGDEFAILLDDIKEPGEAIRIAEQIQNTVTAPVHLNAENGPDQEVVTTASIGIALSKDTRSGRVYNQPADLMRNASTARYRAKTLGRAQHVIFEIDMQPHAMTLLELEAELRRAIEQQELQVYYQPIVSLASSQITGVEALLRWQHPQRGLIYPREFIAILEETRLIVPTGEWLLRTTCAQIKAWQVAGYTPLRMATNLSVCQLQEQNLPELIKKVLAETGLAAKSLELEVTEGIAMRNVEFGFNILNELNTMGLHISIDDFGTGYSSLARLKRLPINTLKIDRAFVGDITSNTDDTTIISAIIAMAHSLNLKVIAEGVETEEQLAFLRSQKCDEIQGHLVSQALPAEALTKLLQERRRLLPSSG